MYSVVSPDYCEYSGRVVLGKNLSLISSSSEYALNMFIVFSSGSMLKGFCGYGISWISKVLVGSSELLIVRFCKSTTDRASDSIISAGILRKGASSYDF